MPTPGILQGLISRIGVWYVQNKNIATFLEAVGLTLDGAADGMVTGARRNYPYRCTVDAFADLSKDRKIRLYPNESEASKRYRLAHWRQIRRTRGCPYGEMLNVQPFFLGPNGATINPGTGDSYLPWIRVYHQSGDPGTGTLTTCHTLSPTGVYTWERAAFAWDWDGLPERWSRFWMIIYLPVGFGSGFEWDDGTLWDSGPLWDGIPLAMLDAIVAGVLEAKAAHSHFAGLITTALQPDDDIPEHPGVAPFDPQSAYTSNADNSTNLPEGNWASAVYPSGAYMGLNARAPWATFYAIDNG